MCPAAYGASSSAEPSGPPPNIASEVAIGTIREEAVYGRSSGRWVEAYPHIARDVVGSGHRIGNHSFYHARLALLSDEGLIQDIGAAEQVIRTVTGTDPKPWFRCPWGESGNDIRILQVLADLGYRHVSWHVAAGEWEVDRTPREIEDAVVREVLSAGENAIIMVHSWPVSVPAALPTIIRRLREAGGEFVTLDDLDPAALSVSPRGSKGRCQNGRVL